MIYVFKTLLYLFDTAFILDQQSLKKMCAVLEKRVVLQYFSSTIYWTADLEHTKCLLLFLPSPSRLFLSLPNSSILVCSMIVQFVVCEEGKQWCLIAFLYLVLETCISGTLKPYPYHSHNVLLYSKPCNKFTKKQIFQTMNQDWWLENPQTATEIEKGLCIGICDGASSYNK